MSRRFEETLTCPRCGRKIEFTVWESLNGNLDPEAKQQLLNGTLFRFTCPKCGFQGEVDYPILYNDMTHRAMVYYVHEEDVEETKKGLEEARKKTGFKMPDYRLRIVTSKNALREKAIIFENGLDDRIVEILKFYAAQDAEIQYKNEEFTGNFFYVENGKYFIQIVGDRVITWELPKRDYEKVRNELASYFERIGDKRLLIGQEWACDFLQI